MGQTASSPQNDLSSASSGGCPVQHSPAPAAPAGCPVDHSSLPSRPAASSSGSSCPVQHSTPSPSSSSSAPAQCPIHADELNPRNQIPVLTQTPAPSQSSYLPTERETSSIPRDVDGRWEYPSPQQFHNALARKGWETPEEHVETMVQIHNFLNEMAWDEVKRWESQVHKDEQLQLVKFKGRPGELSPKARFWLLAGWLLPMRFNNEPPFDRHDWVVRRPSTGEEVRYVIDYYSAPPLSDGSPVFSLDVRPALDSVGSIGMRIRAATEDIWKSVREEGKTEHRNPEGRTYWFNTGTRESVWEKPDDLKSPFERALNQTTWKEYFSGGRKYYYNTQTKESKWDMPEELLLLLEKVEKEVKAAPPPAPVPGAPAMIAPGFAPIGGAPPQSTALAPLGVEAGMEQLNGQVVSLPLNAASVLPARPNLPDEPTIPHNGFTTVEEGEKAFMYLLRKAGVDANWTWDQTMRAIITDPLYKALNTLGEKKVAWQKYVDALKAKEHEEREARLAKIRPAIRNMLKGNPNVFHYTTFPTADRLFAQHPIWQQAKIEAERRLIFEEYVAELKQRDVQEGRAARSRATAKLVSLFKELDVDVLTKWRTAHSLVLDSEEWKTDEDLQSLPNLDILLAFEDYSRVREREFDEQTRRRQVEKTRKERKAREGFKKLLRELVEAGEIKARSKWKQVYRRFSDDKRYLDLLGKPGSNPIELFWDVVDELDQKLDAKVAITEAAVRRHNVKLEAEHAKALQTSNENPMEAEGEGNVEEAINKPTLFVISAETEEDEFVKIVKDNTDEGAKQLTDEEVKEVFKTLRDQAIKHQADEKRRAERKQRHMQDDLRYAMKKLSEPLDINMSYEDAVPMIENLPEYKMLDDDGRRAAFAKYIKRQKERLRELSEDGASTTSRKRKEPASHREPEREREREKGGEKERDRERDYRDRDYEKERGTSKYHRGHEDHDAYHRAREYPRERDRDYRDKDRERDRYAGYKGSKHHREHEREDRRRKSRELVVDEKEERSEKRPRYDREPEAPPKEADERPPERTAHVREETPEEGEI